MKIQPIETSRLYLRGFTPADARFALGIWNDPEMGKTRQWSRRRRGDGNLTATNICGKSSSWESMRSAAT